MGGDMGGEGARSSQRDARAPGGHPTAFCPVHQPLPALQNPLAVPHLRLGPGSAAWTLTVLLSMGCSSGASYASALKFPIP